MLASGDRILLISKFISTWISMIIYHHHILTVDFFLNFYLFFRSMPLIPGFIKGHSDNLPRIVSMAKFSFLGENLWFHWIRKKRDENEKVCKIIFILLNLFKCNANVLIPSLIVLPKTSISISVKKLATGYCVILFT